jgi:hypothetical protein
MSNIQLSLFDEIGGSIHITPPFRFFGTTGTLIRYYLQTKVTYLTAGSAVIS